MYAQLKLELEADDIDYRKSSNLQGILMENIVYGVCRHSAWQSTESL